MFRDGCKYCTTHVLYWPMTKAKEFALSILRINTQVNHKQCNRSNQYIAKINLVKIDMI